MPSKGDLRYFAREKDLMTPTFEISGDHIPFEALVRHIQDEANVVLSDQCQEQVRASRSILDQAIASGETVYGVNTGFGSLYHVRISNDQIEDLQSNLIKSHAAGVGELVPHDVSRLILLLKIIGLSKGYSAVRPVVIERLVSMYNAGLAPAMYQFGSLGASGDLAPLAHLALTLFGEGSFLKSAKGEAPTVSEPAREALQLAKISPITLRAKEGLALINGTQFCTAYGLWGLIRGNALLELSNLCAAASLDAFDGNLLPFDARIHNARPHAGQLKVSETIRGLLKDSAIGQNGGKHIQDPYAFRCVPQVHGATYDTLQHAQSVIETEINAATDNPLIFADGDILSGGNFHAQPIALILDFMAIAMAEIGNISERRTYQLVGGKRGLPDCLIAEPGLQSGLMIAQYTAASIVNRNKILCTPASVDSIISSKGQEDHVSMGATAATKFYEVCNNVQLILAIEFLCAMQALDFRKNPSSPKIEEIKKQYRQRVPFIESDTIVHDLIHATQHFLDKMMSERG